MPNIIVKSIKEAVDDTNRRFIRAGINTVNIVAANARKNAQEEISRNFTLRNNFTINSVRFTQCPQSVTRINDIKSETGITDRASYMARQETGGTRTNPSGSSLVIPTTAARRGSNKNPVSRSYYYSSIKSKLVTTSRQGSRKAALVARAAVAAKIHGFIRLKDAIYKVTNFRSSGDHPRFRLTQILNLKHKVTITPKNEWLNPASQKAAQDMQQIFNSQMEKL